MVDVDVVKNHEIQMLEVYDATDQLQKEQSKTGHLRHLSKIEPFLDRLREDSGVVETFVQAKPDILALIWGPIKLLLLWGDALTKSFTAISDTLEEVGSLLPEFCKVTSIFTDSIHLQEILVLFFRDILDLYLITIKFFSLPRLKLVFEALWPNRRDEIKLVTKHIARHRELMRTEVRLEEIRAADDARQRELKHFAQAEESAIRQEYSTLRAHISPRTYDHDLYRHHADVCEGTGKWLFRDQSFKDWVDHSKGTTRILWLKGIPGAGKTLLASSVIRHTQPLHLTLFAFLTYKDTSTTALSIFHSLIFQLASESIALQKELCQSDQKNLTNSLETSANLLQSLLECAGVVCVVIDGIDEIDLFERSRLLKQLLKLGEACQKCRILLSSRSEDDISTALRGKVAEIKVDQRNAGSIQAFVNHSMMDWLDQRRFTPEVRHEIEGWAAPLASKAKGMFLYVKVIFGMIQYLDNVDEILDQLKHLPESLDDAYGRIFQRLNASTDSTLRLKAHRILGWVSCAPSPMTRHELEQALVINPEQPDQEPRVNSELNVVEFCGPIVEVIDEYVQFVHFTVKEYIFNKKIDGFISLSDMALGLAVRCISYLCQEHHDLEFIEEELEDNILSGAYRFHNFAATYWWRLIKQYLSLSKAASIPDSLRDQLQQLHDTRLADGYQQADQKIDIEFNMNEAILALKPVQPSLAEMLRNVSQFQSASSKADYHLKSCECNEPLDDLICLANRHFQLNDGFTLTHSPSPESRSNYTGDSTPVSAEQRTISKRSPTITESTFSDVGFYAASSTVVVLAPSPIAVPMRKITTSRGNVTLLVAIMRRLDSSRGE
ncbi:NACHT domain-containing protein [Fusarium falciforme]|uniref:NACHT domain-containing protein n=1 Tax=Fusarium falciforme TaxID=195108 RepID=UPI002300F594|nr:NACHT domain-containing protein [Fusarium falciforme]WAO88971.1 NACHT domain-containing protein [Fusarium falciforme]